MVSTNRIQDWGVLFRWGSLWVGGHYSKNNRRWCVNLIPCVTFYFVLEGGISPGATS